MSWLSYRESRTSEAMRARKANRKATFFWQALLIVLPVIVLAAFGFLSLRQDKVLAQNEAAERAQGIADNLLPQLWTALTQIDIHQKPGHGSMAYGPAIRSGVFDGGTSAPLANSATSGGGETKCCRGAGLPGFALAQSIKGLFRCSALLFGFVVGKRRSDKRGSRELKDDTRKISRQHRGKRYAPATPRTVKAFGATDKSVRLKSCFH